MNTGSASDTIIFEQADAIPHYGTVHFITLVTRQPGNTVVRRESHVFLAQPDRHLHEIVFLNVADLDPAHVERSSLEATHQVFATHRATDRSDLDAAGTARPVPTPCLNYGVTRQAEAPFARFRQERRFVGEMGQITDWTTSAVLRDTLLQALLPCAPRQTPPGGRFR